MEVKAALDSKNFTLKRNRFRGFTLIELLVVITIISILAMVGMVSFRVFIKNSRDARRQSDLKYMQSALEQYFSDQKYYPSQITTDPLTFGDKVYLTQIPTDPLGTVSYRYKALPESCSDRNCTNYCLFAQMENLPTPKSDDPINCATDATYNFAVSKP